MRLRLLVFFPFRGAGGAAQRAAGLAAALAEVTVGTGMFLLLLLFLHVIL